jgi:hypothetical protein
MPLVPSHQRKPEDAIFGFFFADSFVSFSLLALFGEICLLVKGFYSELVNDAN